MPKLSKRINILFPICYYVQFSASFCFEFNISMNRNIFSNNSSTNIFNNSNTNNNNSNNSNNNSGQSSNIFTRSQANNQNNSSGSQNRTNIFTQNNNSGSSNNQGTNIFNNQNSSNNIFTNNQSNNSNNNNNNNSSNNIFNNSNNQGNNIFTNNNNNQGGNMFNNNNNQGTNIFNNNNNQGGNLFNNNRQSNNIFNNNPNNNNYNNINNYNNNNNNNNPFFFQDPMLGINFSNLNPEEQKYVFSKLSIQQIRIYIEHNLKMMSESNKVQNIRLSRENSIKGQKVNKFAADFNIKKEILYIKKTIKDNICVPVKNLKVQNEKVIKQSFELVSNLFSSLEKEKRRLIGMIEEEKMSKDIKAEFQQINNQIEDFLRPLYNSHTKGGNFTFVDPDAFCIHISQEILKNISALEGKMDDIIACQHPKSEESEFLVNTIEQLLAYFENVAIEFQTFNARYNQLKKRKLLNHEGTLEKISKKAANMVTAQMKSYKLIKEIEQILQKRTNKTNQ